MFDDARITAGLNAMFSGIDAPPAPMHEIFEKIPHATRNEARHSAFSRAMVAAAAAIVLAFIVIPAISPAFMQTLEARYRDALHALGGIAPPPAPDSLLAKLSSQHTTLAGAQSRVAFSIIPPKGIPRDAKLLNISIAPTGVYSKATHSWRVGPPSVTFSFRRADGRSFDLAAERFDPQAAPIGRYLFEARDPDVNGRPVLIKHERFAWRNGDQTMTAVEGDGINAAEIAAIRSAMRGTVLPRRELHAPDSGTSAKLYIIPKP